MPDEKQEKGFTEDERAAMREYLKEKRGEAPEGEAAVLEKIASFDGLDKILAERIHALVKENAPELTPRTWYGMPAYANKAGKVICFFQNASKFKARYANLGFSDSANLDDGSMWPIAYGLTDINPEVEAKIAALIKKAVS